MNVELAMAALEDAKANPDRFDMMTFIDGLHSNSKGFTKDSETVTVPPCGTTACYAGFASLRAAPVGTRIARNMGRDSVVILPGQAAHEGVHVETYAIKALDITADQANVLFYLDSIGEVERVVKHLAENPDADDDELWGVAARA